MVENLSHRQLRHLLHKFKRNYNYTDKQLALQLDLPRERVMQWWHGRPRFLPEERKKLQALFDTVCEHGIVQLPSNKYHPYPFFLSVRDVKNPFETYEISRFSEDVFDYFKDYLLECKSMSAREKIFPLVFCSYLTKNDYDFANSTDAHKMNQWARETYGCSS